MLDSELNAIETRIAALGRQATELKEAKQLDAAVQCLVEAKALMVIAPFGYTAESWCRLPLYLQHANRHSEAMAEFETLLADLPALARRYAGVGNPNSYRTAKEKRSYCAFIERGHRKVIKAKMALVIEREDKRLRSMTP